MSQVCVEREQLLVQRARRVRNLRTSVLGGCLGQRRPRKDQHREQAAQAMQPARAEAGTEPSFNVRSWLRRLDLDQKTWVCQRRHLHRAAGDDVWLCRRAEELRVRFGETLEVQLSPVLRVTNQEHGQLHHVAEREPLISQQPP